MLKPEVVVDTNVPIVANGKAPQASRDCQSICRSRLRLVRESQILLLDSERLIIGEYIKNLDLSGRPGEGDEFIAWLWENQANEQYCRIISVVSHAQREFEEFPADPDLAPFDRDDRKFVAVALASGSAPEVLNASDTDWWHHLEALRRHGVNVTFLCPELMQ